jgi:hypothetical protein
MCLLLQLLRVLLQESETRTTKRESGRKEQREYVEERPPQRE